VDRVIAVGLFGVYLFFSKTGAHQTATHETQAQAITPVRATSRHNYTLRKNLRRGKTTKP
jgi:hypothetical protein